MAVHWQRMCRVLREAAVTGEALGMFITVPVVVQSRTGSYKYQVEECKLFLNIPIKKMMGKKQF